MRDIAIMAAGLGAMAQAAYAMEVMGDEWPGEFHVPTPPKRKAMQVNTCIAEPTPTPAPATRQVRRQMERLARKGRA